MHPMIGRFGNTALSVTGRLPQAAVHDVSQRLQPSDRSVWNPHRVYRVSPFSISRVMITRLPEHCRGRIVGGDWDQRTVLLGDTVLYRGLAQHFVEGRDWLDTDLHPARYRIDFPDAPRKYASYSVDRFVARGAYLDDLYATLRRQGYRSHVWLGRAFDRELAVNISRDGDLIRNSSGLHRLILSQLLALSRVPVRVIATHSEWRAGSLRARRRLGDRSAQSGPRPGKEPTRSTNPGRP